VSARLISHEIKIVRSALARKAAFNLNLFLDLLYLELDLYQSKGKIPSDVLLLAIDDPKPGIGSGSATLNALLVVTEHLSARAGYTVCFFACRIPLLMLALLNNHI
jgi:hypothetical protein